ncbi:MAG: ABC transporter permease [Reichenbachiella sp.]|uniref:ABC transporter permease n=1 Tax=Reichenbachiella sp. TaxID=2184521 RepID=UPI003296ED44
MKNQGQKTQQPPKLATRLFFWFAGSAAVEDLYGDMEEIYLSNVATYGKAKANRAFWKQVLSLVFSYALKSRKTNAAHSYRSSSISPALLYNFFKVSMRTLIRHRSFSIINILGLSLGMSICLLSITMFYSLQQFDLFHIKKDRIYTVNTQVINNQVNDKFATTAPYVHDHLKSYTNQIEEVVGINDGFSGEVIINQNTLSLSGMYVPPTFLKIFTFPLVAGNESTALQEPFSLILTEKTALRLFGHTNVIGNAIELENKGIFQVTGIMKDYPGASHMQFESLVSSSTLDAIEPGLNKRFEDYRFYTNSYTYLLLNEGINPDQLQSPLAQIAKELSNQDETIELNLQPVTNIAAGENINYSIGPSFDRLTMAFFILLTLIILAPACFNYANLSMARALKRSKEIGMRKVVGGGRRDIFIQFIFETFIITSVALLGAIYIFTVIREEYLAMIIGAEMLDLSINLQVMIAFVGFAVFTSLMAGIIPATYFSKMRAISSLRGGGKAGVLFKSKLRNGLTVFQFCLSTFFIFGAIAMISQYYHSMNYDKGFDEKGKVILPLHNIEPEIIAHEYSNFPEVSEIAFSSGIPGTGSNNEVWVQTYQVEDSIAVHQMFVDNSFLDLMGFKLIQGHSFVENLNQESEVQIIVNQTFVQSMALSENEILKKSFDLPNNQKARVIGVVGNFNHLPVMKEIQPFFFRYDPGQFTYATLKVDTQNVFETATKFEQKWEALNDLIPYEFTFLEDKLNAMYDQLKNPIKMFGFLSFLAVSIACLGLLGMVVFTMENKVKEIGIRKVMGASVPQLTRHLSQGFLKLMLLALVITIPLAYAFYEFMLQRIIFYNKTIGLFEILSSILILSLLGSITVFSQTIKSAKLNPVDNLRYE